jgi:hypothetical protein
MNKPVLTMLTALSLALQSASAEIIWLETERFEDHGGWVSDTQFIDQMGSPYLLAIGLGTPVKDAVTRVTLPRDGQWRLWARTRDWVPQHHPGRFTILLNGKPAGGDFGVNGKPGWHWENGGSHKLSGRIEIRLHDLTGYYGRCDVLVLTDDKNWTPPDDKAAIAALRERHGGISREIKSAGEYDVVVVGGGLAGCTAAVGASRLGARTALIQNRPILGGNASTEILVPPVGIWPSRQLDPLDPRETGLVEEYRTLGNQRVVEGMLYSERLLRWVRLEPNLDLYLNTHATGVELQPSSTNRIATVLAHDAATGQRLRFPGKMFIDCTGDATIGAAAGAAYRTGKESKAMHNEPWAPEKPSSDTMGCGLKYYHQNTGKAQPFTTPPWAMKFPTCDAFAPGRHPRFINNDIEIGDQWKNELGGLQDTVADAEEVRDKLLTLIYGLWDHTKNHCERVQPKAATHALTWVSYVIAKRENRRLLGDVVLTQNDIAGQTLFPDRVAYGAWILDDHHSEGFFHKGSFGQHQDRMAEACKGLPFSIAFRSLYSTNIVNLLMAGRNISATHLAMSDTRVMLTCAVMGHAAGVGAALCVNHGAPPRRVADEYIEELQQQLLKDGAYIMNLPNRDPRDLARKATATASSEDGANVAANVIDGFHRFENGKTYAWVPRARDTGPHWVELAWNAPVAFNVVHVVFQTAALAPKRFRVEAWNDGAWKPLAEVTDNRHRRHSLGLDRVTTTKLRVVLTEPRGICEVRVYDEPDRVVAIARRAHANMRQPDRGPWLPWDQGKPPEQWSTPKPSTLHKKYGGIILDAADAVITGEWGGSTHSTPFIGDDYLTDGNSGKGEKTILFQPNIPKAGAYEVRLAYTALNNRATNVPVTIRTSRGEKKVTVNQRRAPKIEGLFHSLGLFDLDAGDTTTITISNAGTDGYVIVDAIQILPSQP